MHLKIPHKLSKADGVAHVKKMLIDAKPQMGDKVTIEKEEWQGDTLHFAFTAQGQHITGTMEVQDGAFVVDAKLPLMLRLFEGKIEKMIAEQTAQMLK